MLLRLVATIAEPEVRHRENAAVMTIAECRMRLGTPETSGQAHLAPFKGGSQSRTGEAVRLVDEDLRHHQQKQGTAVEGGMHPSHNAMGVLCSKVRP
jgi:hypothetical protein